MLRKLFSLLLAVLLLTAPAALAQEPAQQLYVVDTFVETSALLLPPNGAEEIVYSVPARGMGAVSFTYEGAQWTLTAARSEKNADPSGMTVEGDTSVDVAGCAGYHGVQAEKGQRVWWFDEEFMTAYSLVCSDAAFSGEKVLDIASSCYLYDLKGALIVLESFGNEQMHWQLVNYDENLFSISAGVEYPAAGGAPGTMLFVAAGKAPEASGTAAFVSKATHEGEVISEEVVQYALKTTSSGLVLVDEIKPALTIGTSAGFAPFEYIDEHGQITGFDVELINLLMTYLGRDYTLVDLPFEGLLDSLGDTTDIVISGLSITPEREEKVLFTNPYFDDSLVVVAHVDGVQTTDELAGKRIGVEIGSTGEFLAETYMTGAEIVLFETVAEAMAAVSSGEIDAVVTNAEPAKIYAEGDENIRVLDETLLVDEYGIAVASWNEELQAELNDALKAIHDNAEFDNLYLKWFEGRDISILENEG